MALDENDLPLQNVEIIYGLFNSSGSQLGSFITDFRVFTDAQGKSFVDFEAFPNTSGGSIDVTMEIVGDSSEIPLSDAVTITIEEPKFDYCLALEKQMILIIQIIIYQSHHLKLH